MARGLLNLLTCAIAAWWWWSLACVSVALGCVGKRKPDYVCTGCMIHGGGAAGGGWWAGHVRSNARGNVRSNFQCLPSGSAAVPANARAPQRIAIVARPAQGALEVRMLQRVAACLWVWDAESRQQASAQPTLVCHAQS